ncbi:LOW QUALITY PROTEIN: hypothetical protein BC938DRAFT_470954 [Jimgerdemannia flammicorona]|uniref:Uncharacterized protein n=1 Tax=Jimgerdemannia flammicorona TaxID=994334 RepID=A0A433QV08_9FUNG|nr:LOW QUALITY PROTEIN: hypothetical protein BC938DRAFT_470954 [Jimgerdemannia flammicorona]
MFGYDIIPMNRGEDLMGISGHSHDLWGLSAIGIKQHCCPSEKVITSAICQHCRHTASVRVANKATSSVPLVFPTKKFLSPLALQRFDIFKCAHLPLHSWQTPFETSSSSIGDQFWNSCNSLEQSVVQESQTSPSCFIYSDILLSICVCFEEEDIVPSTHKAGGTKLSYIDIFYSSDLWTARKNAIFSNFKPWPDTTVCILLPSSARMASFSPIPRNLRVRCLDMPMFVEWDRRCCFDVRIGSNHAAAGCVIVSNGCIACVLGNHGVLYKEWGYKSKHGTTAQPLQPAVGQKHLAPQSASKQIS